MRNKQLRYRVSVNPSIAYVSLPPKSFFTPFKSAATVPPPIVPAAAASQVSVPSAPSALTITSQIRNALPAATVTPATPATTAAAASATAAAKPGNAAASDNEKVFGDVSHDPFSPVTV